jgi:hypothetical protein
VGEQPLALRPITTHKSEVLANALEMGSPCLVVLGVLPVKRHWQHADLGCQHLQHGRWHIARIRQEVASPAQGQSWTLKPSLLLAPRHWAT